LQHLKQDNSLQKYKIMQLELQAQHEDYVHKTHMGCLEASIASLRNEVSLKKFWSGECFNLCLQPQLSFLITVTP